MSMFVVFVSSIDNAHTSINTYHLLCFI